jgi:hypothetical protein
MQAGGNFFIADCTDTTLSISDSPCYRQLRSGSEPGSYFRLQPIVTIESINNLSCETPS